MSQPQPFANHYCGARQPPSLPEGAVVGAGLRGSDADQAAGPATPSAWHASASAIAIHFAPLNVFTMSYTNRPSGIQQAISFNRHR